MDKYSSENIRECPYCHCKAFLSDNGRSVPANYQCDYCEKVFLVEKED